MSSREAEALRFFHNRTRHAKSMQVKVKDCFFFFTLVRLTLTKRNDFTHNFHVKALSPQTEIVA